MQRRLALSETDNNLLPALLSRGITEKKSLELLGNIRKGQGLMDQPEHVDQIIGAAPRGKFHNPSGFYVRFLEDNSVVPDPFAVAASDGFRRRHIRNKTPQSQPKQNSKWITTSIAAAKQSNHNRTCFQPMNIRACSIGFEGRTSVCSGR